MNQFDFDRFGFVVVGNRLVVMRRKDREMPTMDWANKVVGVSDENLEYLVRGYITRDRIQFFDATYNTSDAVNTDHIDAAYGAYARLYGVDMVDAMAVPVFNGVKRGEVGENWPPYLWWNRENGVWEVSDG